MNDLYDRHVVLVDRAGTITPAEFREMNRSLQWLERFWSDQIVYRP